MRSVAITKEPHSNLPGTCLKPRTNGPTQHLPLCQEALSRILRGCFWVHRLSPGLAIFTEDTGAGLREGRAPGDSARGQRPAGQATAQHRCRGAGTQLLTFQDVPPLQLLHGRSLAEPSAEKHQNHTVHHGGPCEVHLARGPRSRRWLVHPSRSLPKSCRREGGLWWRPLASRSSQTSPWEGGPRCQGALGGAGEAQAPPLQGRLMFRSAPSLAVLRVPEGRV